MYNLLEANDQQMQVYNRIDINLDCLLLNNVTFSEFSSLVALEFL